MRAAQGQSQAKEPEIRAAITNICHCDTYPRVVAAVKRAAGQA